MSENSYIVSMFQQQLGQLVEKSDGGLAALFIGFDGVSVDVFSKLPSSVDLLSLGSESAQLIGQAQKTTSSLELGILQECSFQTESFNILLRTVNPSYFLVLITSKTAFLGKSKLFLELTALELQGKIGYEHSQGQTR